MSRVDFWSSTEYATFMPALVAALGREGWEADSRFVVRESEYRTARSLRERWSVRARAYGLYPLTLARAIRSHRSLDAAVVCTNTFYAPWVAVKVARSRRLPIVHWVFDLFPDVLVAAGTVKAGSWQERLLKRSVRTVFDRAAANIFLGEHLRAHAELHFGPIPRAFVVPVGCDASPFCHTAPQSIAGKRPLRVLYCGNLGRMHDTDTVKEALAGGLPEGVHLEFRGNGAGFRILESALRSRCGDRLHFGGSMPDRDWREAMLAADVALVTMKPGAEGIVMPSKTYSAMAAGQAVLAICPERSDLANTLRTYDCGWVVSPGDPVGLRRTLDEIAKDPIKLLRRRTLAWKAGQEVFDQRILARHWIDILEGLACKKK